MVVGYKNAFGWQLPGFLEDAKGRLRLQTVEEHRFCIGCHGGIGVTAEYSVGHYTSRLTAIDHLLGDGDWARARLAENVASYETVDPLGAPYA